MKPPATGPSCSPVLRECLRSEASAGSSPAHARKARSQGEKRRTPDTGQRHSDAARAAPACEELQHPAASRCSWQVPTHADVRRDIGTLHEWRLSTCCVGAGAAKELGPRSRPRSAAWAGSPVESPRHCRWMVSTSCTAGTCRIAPRSPGHPSGRARA